MTDADALLHLATRLELASRPYVALAARQAATVLRTPGSDAHDLRVAALRRQALELALRLDLLGLPADAQAIFDEVLRRATGASDAMSDRSFKAWLDAIGAQFSLGAEP